MLCCRLIKLKSPSIDFVICILSIQKFGKQFVIIPDYDICTLEVIILLSDSVVNSIGLLFSCAPFSLYRWKSVRQEGDWVFHAIMFLCQLGSAGVIQCICVNYISVAGVGVFDKFSIVSYQSKESTNVFGSCQWVHLLDSLCLQRQGANVLCAQNMSLILNFFGEGSGIYLISWRVLWHVVSQIPSWCVIDAPLLFC